MMRELVEETYAEAEKIVLVMDNLNTHKPAIVLRDVPARRREAADGAAGDPPHAEARQLAEHGGDRAGGAGPAVPGPAHPQRETLQHEVAAWEQQRNTTGVTIDWQFTTADARIKLTASTHHFSCGRLLVSLEKKQSDNLQQI